MGEDELTDAHRVDVAYLEKWSAGERHGQERQVMSRMVCEQACSAPPSADVSLQRNALRRAVRVRDHELRAAPHDTRPAASLLAAHFDDGAAQQLAQTDESRRRGARRTQRGGIHLTSRRSAGVTEIDVAVPPRSRRSASAHPEFTDPYNMEAGNPRLKCSACPFASRSTSPT